MEAHEVFAMSQPGSGSDPRTLSTTIFRGTGYSKVRGRERKLRNAIPARWGQQVRHSWRTRTTMD
jgi:hypothetical protein